MSAWDVALGIWQNGGQVVVLGAGGFWVATLRRGPGEVAHDRLVRDLNEDLRRWVSDRARQLTADLALIAAYANDPDLEGPAVERLIGGLRKPVPDDLKRLPAGSQFSSGAHLNWQKAAKEQALHEWRDEATRKLRELDEVLAAEGRLHARRRERKGGPSPELRLPPEGVQCVDGWRAPAAIPGTTDTLEIDDPTRADLEPRVRGLEAGGD